MKILVMESGSLNPSRIKPRSSMMKLSAIDYMFRRGHGVKGGAIKGAYQLYSYFSGMKGVEVDALADFSWFTKKGTIRDSEQAISKKYDIIIMNSIRDAIVVEDYVRLHGRAKIIYIDRGNVVHSYVNASPHKRLDPRMLSIAYLLSRMKTWLSVYVGITYEQAEAARPFFGDAIKVELIPPSPDAEYRRLNIAHRFGGAIYVGRLDERQKRVSFLLKGISGLVDSHHRLIGREILRIYGTGPHAALYRKMATQLGIDKNVRFIEHKQSYEPARTYNDAGFFVSTSKWESPGRVFLESMACGTPVLINDGINTVVEPGAMLIEDGKNGLVYRRDDIDDFCAKFYRLYSSRSLRERMGKNAITYMQRFSLQRMLKKYHRIVLGR